MATITQTSKDVIKSPKDTVLRGKVISAEKTTWRKIIDPDKISKFDEPDKDIIQVKYEVEFEGTNISGSDTMAYFEKPMSNSKMGKYLEKYGSFEVGQDISVDFDDKGYSKLRL